MFVYLISDSNNYKIGSTHNLEQRLTQLQTANPNKLIIIESIRSFNYKKLEKLLHYRFKSKRVNGEWFNLTENEVANFITTSNQLNDYIKLTN